MSKTIREAIDNYSGNATHSKTIREAIDNAAGHKGLMYNSQSALAASVAVSGPFARYIDVSEFAFTPKTKTVSELCAGGTLIDICCYPYASSSGIRFVLIDVAVIYYKKPNDETVYHTSKRNFIYSVNTSTELDNAIITGIEGFGISDSSVQGNALANPYFVLLK